MRRIFVTGSADGLGLHAARRLAAEGHQVTLHARSERRAEDARRALPEAHHVVVGDLETLDGMRAVAAGASERFDAVIHNAAIGYQEPERRITSDGLERLFAINALAPYVLTALMPAPARLVYLSSGLHRSGHPDFSDLQLTRRRWSGSQAYSDSKLWNLVLALAIARRWPTVRSNAIEPGWVATKMGGPGAPDDLALGSLTQAWLAASDEPAAQVSGQYFFHQKIRAHHPVADDVEVQERFLAACAELSGIVLPAAPLGAP